MVGYIEDFPPFGWNQGFPEENILELIEFALPYEWQEQILVQGF